MLTAILLAAPAVPAIEAQAPDAMPARPSDPDLWRTLKQGGSGQPAATGGEAVLIRPPPASCSDQAVGFNTLVNAHIPPVGLPQGQGPTPEALKLLAVLFGAAAGAGAMLARNLGKHPEA